MPSSGQHQSASSMPHASRRSLRSTRTPHTIWHPWTGAGHPQKPKHTILYKEKCILCARTTLLLPVCRRERAADRSLNGTFLGLCILALHMCPPSPPFKEVRVPNQSTKDRRAKTEAPHFTPFLLHPFFTSPTRTPVFLCTAVLPPPV